LKNFDLLRNYRYAHRGFHDKPQIPENSIAAFKRAIEHGFGVEFDVHLIKDGNLVVSHDSNVKRCTGVDRVIEDMTLEEVKSLRLEGTDEQIPAFDEVLDLFEDSGLPLIIELKHHGNNHLAVAKAACKRLDSYKGPFCIESFDPRLVRDVRKLRPDIIRGQLSQDYTKCREEYVKGINKYLLTDLFYNHMAKPDFIAYLFEDRENEINQKCIKKGIQPVSWTIRSMEDLITCENEGSIPIFEGFDPGQKKIF